MKMVGKLGMALSLVACFFIFACGSGKEASDPAGIEDQQSFDRAASAATGAPNTRIKSKPPDPSHAPTATFKFICTAAPCTFKCWLDSGSWSKCKSGKTYAVLANGVHVFKVKASKNGVWDRSPASYSWTIQTTNFWIATSTTNAPSARSAHTAVWTGSQMIIWGSGNYSDTGGRYDPSTDSWTATSTTNAPTPRGFHSAVWTGTEMIIWGGDTGPLTYTNTGGKYNPSEDSWTPISTDNAPLGRDYNTTVWTSTEMIIWGGYMYDGSAHYYGDGARYNPSSNLWNATSADNAPSARCGHTAVWDSANGQMIIWGGGYNTGGRYNPSTNSWAATSIGLNVPSARSNHNALWIGTEMIVWGGCADQGCNNEENTGGRYNPVADSWTATSTENAPVGRINHAAVWTGSEMIVWGGYDGNYLNTGGKYNPANDSWTATSPINAPDWRIGARAVWAETRMIIWGGDGDLGYTLNTGGVYWP